MLTTNADGERSRSATQRARCRVAQSLVCTTLVGSVQSHGGIRLRPTSIERNEDEKGAAINPLGNAIGKAKQVGR
jgi:P pilus assembly chaperone PapD